MSASSGYQSAQSVRVFVSHVREDNERLQPLLSALDAWGVDYWFDRDSLAPGDAITPEIHDAIASRDFFIRVVSSAMQRRPKWINIETDIFLGLRAQEISSGSGSRRRLINMVLDSSCSIDAAYRDFSPLLVFDRPAKLWMEELRRGLYLVLSAMDPSLSTKVGGLSPDLSAQLFAQHDPGSRPPVVTIDRPMTRVLVQEELRGASLLLVRAPEEHSYLLTKGVTVIQRLYPNVIGLRDDAVSGVHATITRMSDGEYVIRDGDGTSGSTNGTWVEGKRISTAGIPLKDGDMITVGATILKFQL